MVKKVRQTEFRRSRVAAPLRAALFVLLFAVLVEDRAYGDAIVITKAMTASTVAEIFIGDESIRVEVEIGWRDLPGFRNLMPDGVLERLGLEPEPLADRLPRFFAEDLVFVRN